MRDRFGRQIDYIRVSVTDRCNLRCIYCMPPDGVEPLPHDEILTYEEILKVLEVARDQGVRHVRITGGEPLVRKGLDEFIRGVKTLGFEDVSMTTNGTLLGVYAGNLRDAGLDRVNVSLDTLRPDRFSRITRVGRLEDVLAGIQAAVKSGLAPVKVNAVVMDGYNLDEVADLARLSLDMPVHVRFIEYMPVGSIPASKSISGVPSEKVMEAIEAALGRRLRPSPGPAGAGPARTYVLDGARGTLGFIPAVSKPFCLSCNRLRLTADGKLRPCLASSYEVSLKEVLRGKTTERVVEAGIKKAFERALLSKPLVRPGWDLGEGSRRMCQIGG